MKEGTQTLPLGGRCVQVPTWGIARGGETLQRLQEDCLLWPVVWPVVLTGCGAERGFGAASSCRLGGPWVPSPMGSVPLSAGLVSFSRPPDLGGPPPRKAVLSMSGLSFGVIRVDTEEKLSVLTVQDVGQVLPGGEGCSRSVSCPASG